MKKMRTGYTRRPLTAVVTIAVVFLGLGLMGYALFVGGEPASADTTPVKAPTQASTEVVGSDTALKARLAALAEATKDVVEKIQGPRAEAPKDEALKLTVPDMKRVENLPVYDVAPAGYEKALHDGAAHVKGTGMPWQRQANVYIAGHRIGFPGTNSDMAFYDLEDLRKGDTFYLTDSEGRRYNYKVFKKLIVPPTDLSVLKRIEGKNIVSLQTCTLPDYTNRVVYQAELKDIKT